MSEAGDILDETIPIAAEQLNIAVEFGIDIAHRYGFHPRQSETPLSDRLIADTMEYQTSCFGDSESVQAIAERFGLERAFGFGMTGRQIGFAVHVVKHSHRTYPVFVLLFIGFAADQASVGRTSWSAWFPLAPLLMHQKLLLDRR